MVLGDDRHPATVRKLEMAWEQVIAARNGLDAMLNEIRFYRDVWPMTI